MLGKIISIEQVNDIDLSKNLDVRFYGKGDGFKISTTKHTYYFLIENFQSCCESWGHMQSEDDLNYFIDSELKEVNIVNMANDKHKIKLDNLYVDCGCAKFVDFVTDSGTFQLSVYNDHNGYYGHDILFIKNDDILLQEFI